MAQSKTPLFRFHILALTLLVLSGGIYSMSIDTKPNLIASNSSNPANKFDTPQVSSGDTSLTKNQLSPTPFHSKIAKWKVFKNNIVILY